MAGKDGPPLYEFVHRSERSSKKAMALPEWMRGEGQREAEAPDSTQYPATDIEPEPAAPAPTASEPASTATAAPGLSVDGWKTWMRRPVGMRLPRSTWIMLGVGAFVLVLIVFFVGRKVGRNSVLNQERSYERSVAGILEHREQPPNNALIPPSVEGVNDRPKPPDGGREIDDVPPPPGNAGAAGRAEDPRQPGLNYYRLTAMPAGADEVGRIIGFLAENGVDAAAIPIQNGRSVKLVALRGFERPLSDPAARQFEQKLRTLGRKWKTQHRGSSDWKDLFPEKYRPGRT